MNQDKINKEQQDWNRIAEQRLDVANSEMGVVKTDIAWLKVVVASINSKQWTLVGGIGLALMGIITLLIEAILKK